MRLRGWYSTNQQYEPHSPRWYNRNKVKLCLLSAQNDLKWVTKLLQVKLHYWIKDGSLKLQVYAAVRKRNSWKIFALLVCYAAYIGSYLPTFRDNLSAPTSRVKRSRTQKLEIGLFLSNTTTELPAVLTVSRHSTNTTVEYQRVRTSNTTTASCTIIFVWQ
jgi:hypothetical protein